MKKLLLLLVLSLAYFAGGAQCNDPVDVSVAPYTQGFETVGVSAGYQPTIDSMAKICWTVMAECPQSPNVTGTENIQWGIKAALVGWAYPAPSNAWRFSAFSHVNSGTGYSVCDDKDIETNYLISPKLETTSNAKYISFYWRASSTTKEKIQVGYSTNSTIDTTTFTWGPLMNATGSSMARYENKTIPGNATYIAIRFVAAGYSDFVNIDNIEIGMLQANAATLTGFVHPADSVMGNLTDSESITVEIKNYGSDAITDQNVKFTYQIVEDGVTFQETPQTFSLAGGVTGTYTFSMPADLGAYKTYTIRAWIDLTGDANHDDDTIEMTVRNMDCQILSNLPYSQGFENIDATLCWTGISNNTQNTPAISTDQGNSGTKSWQFTSATTATGAIANIYTQYLISPVLANDGSAHNLTFYQRQSANVAPVLCAGYSTTGNNVEDFTWGGPLRTTVGNAWQKSPNIRIPENAKYIAFRFAPENNGLTMFIDDIEITAIPATDLALTSFVNLPANAANLTATEAVEVTITNNGTTTYNDEPISLHLNVDGLVYYATESAVTLAPGESSTVHFANVGLGLFTSYPLIASFDALAVGADANDTLKMTVTNRTCGITAPYSQNFQSADMMNCWKTYSANYQNAYGSGLTNPMGFVTDATAPFKTGNQAFRFSSNNKIYPTVTGTYEDLKQVLITPKIAVGSDPKVLKFWYKTNSDDRYGEFRIGYATTNPVSYNDGEIYNPAALTWSSPVDSVKTSTWQEYVTTIPAITEYVAIEWKPVSGNLPTIGAGSNARFFVIDSLTIAEMPSVGASVTAITQPAAVSTDLTNSEVVKATIYNAGSTTIANYKITLEIDNTIKVTEFKNNVNITSLTSYEHTFAAVDGLEGAGNHTIRVWIDVAEDVDKNDDTVSQVINNIHCAITSYPVEINFESEIAPCWTSLSKKGNSWFGRYNMGNEAYSGSYVWRFYFNSGGDDQFLFTPELSTDKVKRVEFYYKKESNSHNEPFRVGYSTTTRDTAAFTWLELVNDATLSWKKYTSNPIPAEAKYIAIKFQQPENNYFLYIDDLTITGTDPVDNEAAITAVVYPQANNKDLTDNEKVTITLANNGTAMMSNFPVYLSVNGGEPIEEMVQTSITPYTTADYEFSTGIDLSVAATYEIKVWVALSGDADQDNDTLTVSVENVICEITGYPYLLPFENTDFLECWTAVAADPSSDNADINDNSGWGVRADEKHSGTKSWRFSSCNVDATNYDQYLVSPKLSATSGNKSLSFYYKRYSTYERFMVGYSTTTPDIAAFTWSDTIGTAYPVDWTEFSTLTIPNNALYVAIRYNPDASRFYIWIDDLAIGEVLATDVALTAINEPVSGSNLTSSENVKIAFKNAGSSAITAMDAHYQVDDQGVVTESIQYVNYTSGQSGTHDFVVPADLSETGTHTIKVWLTLPGDLDANNDTLSVTIENIDCTNTSLPYTFGFEENEIAKLACWTTAAVNASYEGTISTEAVYAHSGTNSWSFAGTSYAPYYQYLITPVLPVTNEKQFSFYYMPRNVDYPERFRVGYSTTDNDTASFVWGNIITWRTGKLGDTSCNVTIPQNAKYAAIQFVGGWNNGGDDYGYSIGLYIDDISITESKRDAKILSIASPNTYGAADFTANNDVEVQLEVENTGDVPLDSVYCSYVFNGGAQVSEWVDRSLSPIRVGGKPTLAMSQRIDMSRLGQHTLKAWVNVAIGGNIAPTADTVEKTYNVIAAPYTEFSVPAIVRPDSVIMELTDTVAVTFKNTGTKDIGTIFGETVTMYYSVNDGEAVSEICTFGGFGGLYATLTPNSEATYKFATPVTFATTGTYTIKAWAAIVPMIGSNPPQYSIDTAVKTVRVASKQPNAEIDYINAPTPGEGQFTAATSVALMAKNTGTVNLDSFWCYMVVDGGEAVSELVVTPTPVEPTRSRSLWLNNTADLSALGPHTIKAWIKAVYGGVVLDSVKSVTGSYTTVPAPYTDLAVTAIVEPAADSAEFTNEETISAVIRNVGTRTISGSMFGSLTVDLWYSIDGGEAINGQYNINGTTGGSDNPHLLAGESVTFVFETKADLSVKGGHNIKVWASTISQDVDLTNDTISRVVINNKLGVGNSTLSSAPKVSVYPNPTTGHFNVTVSNEATMEVITVTGVTIRREVVSGTKELSLSNAGIYLLRFIDKQGRTTTQRLIVK
ncbi:MAG: T9SS type A sorting domain-containing protein [Bacteroidales bacterium]|jgi:hypothetical protein|nr:T9SS type A sorting domain-containing protein [Bacteroidales bacterium]